MKKYNKRNFSGIWFYVVLLAIVLLIFSVLNYRPGIKQILYSDLLNYIKSEQITEMVIEDRKVTIALKEQNPVGDSNKRIASIPSIGILYENAGDEIQKQLDSGSLKLDTPAPEEFPWWVSFLPTLLTVGIFIAFWFFFMRQAQGGGKAMSFGKSTAKMTQGSETHVTFKDVAGADEEKEELEEIVDFLRDSSKFIELGARIPKGILLVGPPGTGKTLLAKAVAGEAKVPFFSISGSDFVEMFVGVGASRVRDLFEQAKKNSPSIIFIDEIDAVGRHRGAGLGGGHDEREQTLNQLLVEMDGFGANEGIIIIAATNRPDILDPALLRPGRFDRQVVVNTPDAKGREEILKVHSRAKPLASDVDLSVLAKTTSGFTGADLENLMNEAALLAAKKGQKKINMKDIEDSVIKVIAGPEKRSKVVSDKEKKLVSYHEAGHAIIHHVLPHCDPVHEVSIIQRGRAGGYTLSLPKEDKNYVSKEDMLDNIVSLLGGRVAEKLVLDDISTGASNDIERASKIARDMVTKYGMSERLGPISFRSDNDEVFLGMSYSHSRDYSEEVAAEIDGEVRRIIEDSYKRCTDILTENMAKLHNVAGALFEKEKINGDEFVQLFHMDETTSNETEETKTIEPDSDFEPENA
ncbi:MAG: ATP-dependent metallopeptidase FtsH/Yme1/Tma family protein [Clostridiales bacterium]|nr:ATP-dependent metallopeptidase FtsH/Yme1/Tma family protein [Clostridiales bacterium]